jgi:flavin-dependent dehydrogenase
MATTQFQPSIEEYDVVVSGAGPAGLALAYEAISQGKKTLILEAREEKYAAIRPQLVFLQNDTRDYLKELYLKAVEEGKPDLEDKRFYEKLADPIEHVAIKDIQRFLTNRIKESKNSTFSYQSKIETVNMDKGLLSVARDEKKSIIHFKHLAGADGLSHYTADKVGESGYPIKFKKTFESKSQYFASAYYSVRKRNGDSIPLPQTPLNGFKVQDKYLGFVYYNRHSHAKSDKQQLKLYVTTAITKDDYEKYEKDKKAVLKDLITHAELVFPKADYNVQPVKPSKEDKAGLVKDNLKFQIFSRIFYEASTPSIQVGEQNFMLLGDAYLSPDFYQGSGTNFALMQAKKAGELLAGKITLEYYNSFCKLLAFERLLQTHYLERYQLWVPTPDKKASPPKTVSEGEVKKLTDFKTQLFSKLNEQSFKLKDTFLNSKDAKSQDKMLKDIALIAELSNLVVDQEIKDIQTFQTHFKRLNKYSKRSFASIFQKTPSSPFLLELNQSLDQMVKEWKESSSLESKQKTKQKGQR